MNSLCRRRKIESNGRGAYSGGSEEGEIERGYSSGSTLPICGIGRGVLVVVGGRGKSLGVTLGAEGEEAREEACMADMLTVLRRFDVFWV